MTGPADPHQVEPPTTLVRSLAVRRADDDLDSFADTIIKLIDDEVAVVDLSHRDRRADIIELRVASASPKEHALTAVPAILADEVRNRGFAVWPGFASPEQCDVLRNAAGILATGEHAHQYPKSTRVWDLYQYDPAFVEMITDAGLADLIDDLLGRYYLLSDYSLNVVNPGQPIDDWHIDYPYNEMPTIVAGGILGLQCVLALDDFTETNGATRLVPSSHRPPCRPDEPWPTSAETFTAESGTLLIMAAATWHHSGLNSSGSPRTAILMSFVERWIRPLSDPLPTTRWAHDQRLQVMLGLQRPAETINGVPV